MYIVSMCVLTLAICIAWGCMLYGLAVTDESCKERECISLEDYKTLMRLSEDGVTAIDSDLPESLEEYAYHHYGIYFVGCLGRVSDSSTYYDFYYYDNDYDKVVRIHATFEKFLSENKYLIKNYS